MGFIDRLFGATSADEAAASTALDRALENYRHVLATAPAETIERVHAEAFARLEEEHRAVLYEELSRGAGTGERPLSSEPETLARAATRAEQRRPGTIERALTAPAFAGSWALSGVAAFVLASPLTSAFLPWGAANLDGFGAASAPLADGMPAARAADTA
ncbi:MAG: hypothetical protein J0G30_12820 [Actinomycetales bacterium]|nr:hypothetical protein [Actinomycetales bacterium]